MGIEDPPEDVAEQHIPVVADIEDDEVDAMPDDLPWDADPADVAEQLREAPVDDI
ncbi:MAG TPA: hypothetical protein VK735_24565 [Pseudonocardia sp.]|uniref:hypothetical protein n=1 Tax=Pseudonocardia sp. TaxID=60912 RepID=UPI002BE8A86E|nr:hypothetical protein [Pseudonocardia sp.]HTF50626.1 hypothetical protein [Pseudonocardia sp.]